MQGKRTDLLYDKIVKYIAKKQPISITDLHIYLSEKYDMKSSTSRSRLIKRLEDADSIKRIGKRHGNNSVFIAR
jgi:DNA-binding Lrp family transcriptional regulator